MPGVPGYVDVILVRAFGKEGRGTSLVWKVQSDVLLFHLWYWIDVPRINACHATTYLHSGQ